MTVLGRVRVFGLRSLLQPHLSHSFNPSHLKFPLHLENLRIRNQNPIAISARPIPLSCDIMAEAVKDAVQSVAEGVKNATVGDGGAEKKYLDEATGEMVSKSECSFSS
jgi:hypothetical protein